MFHFKNVLFQHFYPFQAGMSNVCAFVQDNMIIPAKKIIFQPESPFKPFSDS